MDQQNNTQATLSWPSLFWALVAVALNTMSQPSGKTLGFPSRHSFFLRISPFVCGAHVVYSVARLGFLSVEKRTTGSNVNVFAVLMLERFEDAKPTATEAFISARKSVGMLSVLFALGAFLQAVKIFAVIGIPFSKACCAMYLASFLLDLLLLRCAPESTEEVQDYRPTHVARRTADKAFVLFGIIALLGSELFEDRVSFATTMSAIVHLLPPAWTTMCVAPLLVASNLLLAPYSILYAIDHWNRVSLAQAAYATTTAPLVMRILETSTFALYTVTSFYLSIQYTGQSTALMLIGFAVFKPVSAAFALKFLMQRTA